MQQDAHGLFLCPYWGEEGTNMISNQELVQLTLGTRTARRFKKANPL